MADVLLRLDQCSKPRVQFVGDVCHRSAVRHPKFAALSHRGLERVRDYSPVKVQERIDEQDRDPSQVVFIGLVRYLDDPSQGIDGVTMNGIDVAVSLDGVVKSSLFRHSPRSNPAPIGRERNYTLCHSLRLLKLLRQELVSETLSSGSESPRGQPSAGIGICGASCQDVPEDREPWSRRSQLP